MPRRTKKRSQGVFEDYGVCDPAPELPSQSTTGYLEQHTEYTKDDGGNRNRVDTTVFIPPSPVKPSKTQPSTSSNQEPVPQPVFQPIHEEAEELYSDPPTHSDPLVDIWTNHEDRSEGTKRKRADNEPLHLFTELLDVLLEECLRLEAPDQEPEHLQCHDCQRSLLSIPDSPQADNSGYRCRDCDVPTMLCDGCVVNSHRLNFLHRIERWNGSFFCSSSLKELGMRIQLGHEAGRTCPHPRAAFNDDFVIVDSDAVHMVSVDYCGCPRSASPVKQLLRARLFPATTIDPKRAATFKVLETFQMLNFTACTNAYDFLGAIYRRTNNISSNELPPRYVEFMRMVHVWRHVRLLKRFGRGHATTGARGTYQGECAVMCPACPHPGINMPEGWESAPAEEQWIHALFLAIDANFRLRRKNVSSDEKDPGFNRGFAYIVEEIAFKEYLKIYDKVVDEDKSTCNNHDAIKSASIRRGKGLAASGLGTCQCSRHDMKRPTGAGDVQKGERYVNMDWITLQTLRHNIPRSLVLSYDIVCQWMINLLERCRRYPPNPISEDPDRPIQYLIPKFHLPAHIIECQEEFAFGRAVGVGRTDGEAPERGWAAVNNMAYSTREMGPGARRDTLDDAFGHTNWKKTTEMSSTLARRADEAVFQRCRQIEAFEDFAHTFKVDVRKLWTKQVQDWEQDHSNPNPYATADNIMTEKEVRLELAKEERAALEKGTGQHLNAKMSPSGFILEGLALERARRKNMYESEDLGPHATPLQESKVMEATNNLTREYESWEKFQRVYMPAVTSYRDSIGEGAPESIKTARLLLPSEVVHVVHVDRQLLDYEFKLRVAQAHTALRDIRSDLLLRSHMWISKKRYTQGTRMRTRSNVALQAIGKKINRSAARYRHVRRALEALSSVLKDYTWTDVLRPLDDKDLTGLTSMMTDNPMLDHKDNQADESEDEASADVVSSGHGGARRRKRKWVTVTDLEGGVSAGGRDDGADTKDGAAVGKKKAGGRRQRRERKLWDEEKIKQSEGRVTLSWIWTARTSPSVIAEGRQANGEKETGENQAEGEGLGSATAKAAPSSHFDGPEAALRIEFCRARARAHRWQEECLLLAEEMRRVERFFRWDRDRWTQRAEECTRLIGEPPPRNPGTHPDIYTRDIEQRKRDLRGKMAYAKRQSSIRAELLASAKETHKLWLGELGMMEMEGYSTSGRVEFVGMMDADKDSGDEDGESDASSDAGGKE